MSKSITNIKSLLGSRVLSLSNLFDPNICTYNENSNTIFYYNKCNDREIYDNLCSFNRRIYELGEHKIVSQFHVFKIPNSISNLIILNKVPKGIFLKLNDLGPISGTSRLCYQLIYKNGILGSISRCGANSRKNIVLIFNPNEYTSPYIREKYKDHLDDRMQFTLPNGVREDIAFIRIIKL